MIHDLWNAQLNLFRQAGVSVVVLGIAVLPTLAVGYYTITNSLTATLLGTVFWAVCIGWAFALAIVSDRLLTPEE